MKKIFGLVLALALLLSMSVIPSPAAAAGTITCVDVDVDNPLVGAPSVYTITFIMQEPVEGTAGEYIDVCFPADTDVTPLIASPGCVELQTPPGPINANTVTNPGGGYCLRINFNADIPEGTVVLEIGDPADDTCQVVNPTKHCEHTLCVGTTAETCTDCPAYDIYTWRCDLEGDGTADGGWNLISLPVMPVDTDIEVVLKHLLENVVTCCEDFSFKVYYYDCTTWYAYNNASYGSLTTMEECKAYWIWVSGNKSFYVKGDFYPDPPGPPLKKCYHECWNMVGFTSDVPREPFDNNPAGAPDCDTPPDLSPYFGSLTPPNTIIYILRWDTGLDMWGAVIQSDGNYPDATAPNSNCLEPCEGYWVAFSQDACFVPPPPGV